MRSVDRIGREFDTNRQDRRFGPHSDPSKARARARDGPSQYGRIAVLDREATRRARHMDVPVNLSRRAKDAKLFQAISTSRANHVAFTTTSA